MTAATSVPDECRGTAGKVAPVVDRNRCEAKDDCVRACPFDVFEVRPLAEEDRAKLSWLGRVKTRAHGGNQAYVVRPGDCHACQLCVDACPENALKLAPIRA